MAGRLIWIILILALLIVLIWIFYFSNNAEQIECVSDKECVPAGCCHPNECISIEGRPDCSGVFCTAVCEPGTLDCGQGYCGCVNNKCKAVLE